MVILLYNPLMALHTASDIMYMLSHMHTVVRKGRCSKRIARISVLEQNYGNSIISLDIVISRYPLLSLLTQTSFVSAYFSGLEDHELWLSLYSVLPIHITYFLFILFAHPLPFCHYSLSELHSVLSGSM